MALMRPLSGSGSQGVLVEILTNESFSDTLKYTAATMFGSTETTFYVLAVYFGSVAVITGRSLTDVTVTGMVTVVVSPS